MKSCEKFTLLIAGSKLRSKVTFCLFCFSLASSHTVNKYPFCSLFSVTFFIFHIFIVFFCVCELAIFKWLQISSVKSATWCFEMQEGCDVTTQKILMLDKLHSDMSYSCCWAWVKCYIIVYIKWSFSKEKSCKTSLHMINW